MIIYAYKEKHDYLLFVDLEFFNPAGEEESHLIQFAGLLFKKVDDGIYQLMRSFNEYVTDKVCYPFAEYTAITTNFLEENGVPLKDLVLAIEEDFLDGIDLDKTLLITHGLKNDRAVMNDNGIKLKKKDGSPIDGYCTFSNSRRILKRSTNLSLSSICEEAGYYLHNAHNAFSDVWGEVAVFTYIRKIEEQEKKEC